MAKVEGRKLKEVGYLGDRMNPTHIVFVGDDEGDNGISGFTVITREGYDRMMVGCGKPVWEERVRGSIDG
jgi:hypothetical protein